MTFRPLPPLAWDVIFSLKTFAAAVLALWIAFAFDLENPYWAMTTVYIVANPLAGAATSKAVYRLIGTVVGGTASVVLVPNLVNAPELLCLGIALWVGFCLVLSLLDRSPRSYAFMLAGYTAALTSLPLVNTPENVFTYATGRVIEISVAIVCTAVISRIVFPRHAGAVLAARVDAWLTDAAGLLRGVLTASPEAGNALPPPKLFHKLAADAADIRLFTSHVAYDTSGHRDRIRASRELQARMATLLPIASGLADVRAALARIGALPAADLSALLDKVQAMLGQGKAAAVGDIDVLSAELDRLAAPCGGRWQVLLQENLVARLKVLLETWSECLRIRAAILSGGRVRLPPKHARALVAASGAGTHVDVGMALFSGFSAALAILIGCAIWISTGWSSGAGMPLISGILICFFAAMDNPTPIVRKFLVLTLYALAMSFVFVFAYMPAISTFTELVIGLAFLFVPLGLLIAKPATFLQGMAICTNIPTMLTLASRPTSPDLATFLNSNLATIFGTIMTIYIATIVRAVRTDWSARRILRAGWADIAALGDEAGRADYRALMHRMLDRQALITPRLAALPEGSALLEANILRDTRVGINLIGLMRARRRFSRPVAEAIATVGHTASVWYRARRRDEGHAPDTALLLALDECLLRLADEADRTKANEAAMATASLRYSLFPDAPDFDPPRRELRGEPHEEPLREAAE